MPYNQSPFTQDDIPQLIGIRTHIGGFFFDAYLKLDHERSLTITEHPVEEGASITDHAFVNPKGLSIEVGMSDVCVSLVEGQFAQRFSRSVSAYDTLERLLEERIPISLHTKLATYHNMLIENLTAPDDYQTRNGLRATAFFREVIVVRTDTATLPNRTSRAPHATGATNRGEVQPVDNRSALRRATDALGFTPRPPTPQPSVTPPPWAPPH